MTANPPPEPSDAASADGEPGDAVPDPVLAERLRRLPALGVPTSYFAIAHISLAMAFLVMVREPAAVAWSLHHPYTIAVVHLITLGWITSSILGALYLIMPMAMGSPMPAGRLDVAALVCYAAGVSGMVAHFWIAKLPGMAWSAGFVMLGALFVLARAWRCVAASKAPPEVKLHFHLAGLNFVLAGAAGLAVGFERMSPYLPSGILPVIHAHAHLAVLGWATMTVMAAGYRLLPMLLPAPMPTGRAVYATAALLQVGTLGLFITLALESPWSAVFALVCAAAIALFVGRVRWMAKHRKPRPKDLRQPDLGVWQVAQALLYLAVSVVLGVTLALTTPAEWKRPAAAVYGACALIGFLSQMVVGVSARLLPMFAWLRGYAAAAYREPPPSPNVMSARALQVGVFSLWTLGVPLLVVGLAMADRTTVGAAGAVLLAAVIAGAASHVWVVRHAFGRRGRAAGRAQPRR